MPKRKILGWDSSSDDDETKAGSTTINKLNGDVVSHTRTATDIIDESPSVSFVEDIPLKRQRTLPDMDRLMVPPQRRLSKENSKKYDKLSTVRPVVTSVWKALVFIRGEITQRVYSIWEDRFHNKLEHLGIVICKSYSAGINILVVPKNISKTDLDQWLQQLCDKHLIDSPNIPIATNQWLINMIEMKKILSPADFNAGFSSVSSIDLLIAQETHIDLALKPADASSLNSNNDSNGIETNLQVVQYRSKASSSIINSIPQNSDTVANQQNSYPMFAKHYRGYACMQTGGLQQNYNKHITDILEDLQSIYELINDDWRAKGYKTCVGILKQLPRITSIEQVQNIKGIGISIREKIEEILLTGSLKKLSYFKKDPKIAAITELAKIWGVGEKTAIKFIKQGYKSVEDLRQRGLHILNPQQQIGLKHYEEFMIKIPRSEIEEILSVVQDCVASIAPGAFCMVCGSYRRGKPSSGDTDIIITPPEGIEELPDSTLCSLIEQLSSMGFLTDHLALPFQSNDFPLSAKKSHLPPAEQSPSSPRRSPSQLLVSIEERNQGSVRAKPRCFPMNRQGSSTEFTVAESSSTVSQNHYPILTIGSDVQGFPPPLQQQSQSDAVIPPFLRHQSSSDSTISTQSKLPHRSDDSSHPFRSRSSYMGVCKLQGENKLHRRIDIKVYPRSLLPFATLYFTGSDHFNRSMRLYAKRRGFHLSDKGLYYQQRIPYFPNLQYQIGEYIPCNSEEDIFSVLGLPFKTPAERNVFDNDHLFKDHMRESDTLPWDPEESCITAEESSAVPQTSFQLRDGDSDTE